MSDWEDTTSYSRGERDKAEPREWELAFPNIRIKVHRLHGIPGWFLSCHALGVERKDLKCEDLEKAKAKAVNGIIAWLKAALGDVEHWSRGRDGGGK